jgi:hypothetical protein
MYRVAVAMLVMSASSFFFTNAANAQETVRVNMTAPKFPLLFSKNVQQELQVSDEQMKKVREKLSSSGPSGATFTPGAEGSGQKAEYRIVVTPGAGNVKLPEGGVRALPALPDFSKTDEEIDKLLEPSQRDRLKQLWLQQQGMMALAQDKVAGEIGLEPEQRALVKEALDHHQNTMRDFFMDPEKRSDQTKMRDFFKTQKERTENDISLLLTEKQKETWQKMLGPKFDFKSK